MIAKWVGEGRQVPERWRFGVVCYRRLTSCLHTRVRGQFSLRVRQTLGYTFSHTTIPRNPSDRDLFF